MPNNSTTMVAESTPLITNSSTQSSSSSHRKSLSLSQTLNKDPDTIKNALLTSAKDTESLTGTAAIIRAGFPIKLVDIGLKVTQFTNCRITWRAGVPPNADRGEWLDFKSISWKTKTYPGDNIEVVSLPGGSSKEVYHPGSFLACTIPQQHAFRRTAEDSLPDPLPDNSTFVPLPVRLREILFHATQPSRPIYTNLRIEGDYLKFNMPSAPVLSNREFIFSLNLAQKKDPAFKIRKESDAEKNIYANHECMPWRDVALNVNEDDIVEWCFNNGLQWDNEKFGCTLKEALDYSYFCHYQTNENSALEEIKVAATIEHSLVEGQPNIYRLITGDVDLCYIASPITITVFGEIIPIDPKFMRLHMTTKDATGIDEEFLKDFIELYVLHKNAFENRTKENAYYLEESEYKQIVDDLTEFLPSAGYLTTFELLNIYLINKEYRIAYPNFGNPLQHGAETANPGKLSSLEETAFHIYVKKETIKSHIESLQEELKCTEEEAVIHYVKKLELNDNSKETIKAHIESFQEEFGCTREEAVIHYINKLELDDESKEKTRSLIKAANNEGEMHIYEKTLTFNENDLLLMVKEATEANLYMRVHPGWILDKKFNNKEWALIVEEQMREFPQYVDEKVKEALKEYNHIVQKLIRVAKDSPRLLLTKMKSSPLFNKPTMTDAPTHRLSQSTEFKEGQLDILKPLRKNSMASLRSPSNEMGVSNNHTPNLFKPSQWRRQSVSIIEDIKTLKPV